MLAIVNGQQVYLTCKGLDSTQKAEFKAQPHLYKADLGAGMIFKAEV